MCQAFKILFLWLFHLNSISWWAVGWFGEGFCMELKWRFISFHPRNSVIEAIKSAQGNDLTIPDVDSPSKRSLWRESGCQPLSYHDFISPESPHFYSNTLGS